MGTLHGRKKRQLRAVLVAAAVLLAAVAAIFFFLRPFEGAPSPSAPNASLTPTQSAAVDTSPYSSPQSGENSPVASQEPQNTQAPLETGLSLYEASLTVDAEQNLLFGKLRLTYVNPYPDSLFEVVLNLFPNAVSPKCLMLETVTVAGLDADYTLDENGTHLTLPLTHELKTGESTEIYISYAVQVPKTSDRFGTGKNRLMFGNAIPVAAVYENGAWRMDEYISTGDSFYSEAANYRVVIAAPQNYTVSCTGSVEEQRTQSGVTTMLASAYEVRDFAFSLHKNAYVSTQNANGIEVVGVALTQKAADFAAKSGSDALLYFSDKICDYPYNRLCVVDFDGSGGMEYPGLIMINTSLLSGSTEEYAAMVVAHEVAHQWFYGIVGSDQLNEPWVDESLVEFLGFAFSRAYFGDTVYNELWQSSFDSFAAYERTLRLDAPLKSFEGNDYFFVVYAYGAHVMRDLFNELGEDMFFTALQNYVGEHRYKNAEGTDLIAAFSEVAGNDMGPWFEAKFAP